MIFFISFHSEKSDNKEAPFFYTIRRRSPIPFTGAGRHCKPYLLFILEGNVVFIPPEIDPFLGSEDDRTFLGTSAAMVSEQGLRVRRLSGHVETLKTFTPTGKMGASSP